MFDATIDDVGGMHAALDRFQGVADFGEHAAGDGVVLNKGGDLFGIKFAEQFALLIENASGVGEEHELFSLEDFGEFASNEVGVDIVGLAILTNPNGGNDGNEVALDKEVDDGGVEASNLADMADIDDFGDVHFRIVAGEGQFARVNEVGIFAGETYRGTALAVNESDDIFVDETAEDHLDDVHGFAVGDAHALEEFAFFAESFQKLADLGAAAVDDHGVHADSFHENDVAGEAVFEIVVDHGVAAVFNDEGFADKVVEIGESFDEDVSDGISRSGGQCHGEFPAGDLEGGFEVG